MVQSRRDYSVDRRSISLPLINSRVDYDAQFPPEYEPGHTAGLRLLRLAARTRAEHGREAASGLYAALGAHIFDGDPVPDEAARHGFRVGTVEFVEPILTEAGLPTGLSGALDDASWDPAIQAETDEARRLTGKDVGTPIIHFQPPAGGGVLRAADQPSTQRRRGCWRCGTTSWGWRASRGSPSSRGASVNYPS